MKTVLVTNGNMSSLLALSDFIDKYKDDLLAVFVTTHLPSQKNNFLGVWRMLLESGFSYTYFKLFTNIILPNRVSMMGAPKGIAEYIRLKGLSIPIIYTADINSKEYIEQVKSFNPEILLSFSSTVRFSDELTDVPSRASINAHYALLPGYAGLSPYYWYLRNSESNCGVTLHQITSMLDAGPIIEQRSFSLDGVNSVLEVLTRQSEMISPMLIRYYEGKTNESEANEQDMSLRSYFRHPMKKDMIDFYAKNNIFYNRQDVSKIKKRLKSLINNTDL